VPVFKNARFVGRLGSGLRLVADRADVVPATGSFDPVGRPTGPM